MIAELSPFFPGPLRRFGEGVTTVPPHLDAWPGRRLTEPAALQQRLAKYRDTIGAEHERAPPALASWWARHYCVVLVPPVLVAAAALGRTVPISLEEVDIAFGPDGLVSRIHLRSSVLGNACATLDETLAAMTHQHLAPVFATLSQLTRASPRVLWSHAAEFVQYVGMNLLAHPALDASRRDTLAQWLRQDRGADGRPHPYRAAYLDRPLPDGSEQRVRRVCCLKYRLDGDDYCGTCPLRAECAALC
ncbi:siderophore-iron reductase FhuF [Cupriavidus gilardii]|uniref:siderophore-iron reductase FhuF n=1 Tax=Cupriavidus gilardii TaxID=82541 RepID=UPI001ABEAE1C|nr:siderophore-iron reductase FhuF [Cupriavidus gilardii]MBO4122687.1 siderophore-iron reductase FhuF [Cupriavidus gilardii]